MTLAALRQDAIKLLFAGTVFVAAALVFLVQPMITKQLLPAFGGSATVWNTAVVFFQLVLLAGYVCAHLSLRAMPLRRHWMMQLALVVAVLPLLPFALRADLEPPGGFPPAAWVVVVLATAVGLPYFVVTTASPVLQRWFAGTGHDASGDPYFLYVASNAGSLTGLLAFPLVLEPALDIRGQTWVWAATYALFALGLAACSIVVVRRGAHEARQLEEAHVAPIARARALRWSAVAALPASLMLGVTSYITTEITSAPLLWVVPLALYLISFMATFGRRVRVDRVVAGWCAASGVVGLALVDMQAVAISSASVVLLHLWAMFAAALLAHAWLYADRPPAQQLTLFYAMVSLGGVAGGAFAAIAAPLLFEQAVEYPLLIVGVLLLRRNAVDLTRFTNDRWLTVVADLLAAITLVAIVVFATRQGWLPVVLASVGWITLAIALGLVAMTLRRNALAAAITGVLLFGLLDGNGDVLYQERSFYGVLRVVKAPDGSHRLLHGTTLHGSEDRRPGMLGKPTTYYTREGPVGDIFDGLQHDRQFSKVGVVGLGTGSLVVYGRMWQSFTFYEIDPGVVRIAKDPRYFSYLDNSTVSTSIVEGDARLRLQEAGDVSYDLLVLDAYSSDAVPVHLLTTEAMKLYVDRLAPGGRIVMHVSSRHLMLEPVVAANARTLGLAGLGRVDVHQFSDLFDGDVADSHWLVLAREQRDIAALARTDGWRPLVPARAGWEWTDDYSNVARSIRWMPGL